MTRKPSPPDGAKAFRIASDMEDQIITLRRLFSIARLLSETSEDRSVTDALAHIGSYGDDVVTELEDSQRKIFHATWGFVHGKGDAQ